MVSSFLACSLVATSAQAQASKMAYKQGIYADFHGGQKTLSVKHDDDSSDSSSGADYKVGGTTMFFHDKSRPFDQLADSNASYLALPFGNVFLGVFGSVFNGLLLTTDVPEATMPNSVRTIHTTIYYPVSKDTECNQPLTMVDAAEGDLLYAATASAGIISGVVPGFAANPEFLDGSMPGALESRVLSAVQNVVIAECKDETMAKGKFPLVFLTHGDGNNSYGEPARAQALAQNGYIVVSMGHTGNPAGSLAPYDPKYAQLNPDLANVIPPNSIYPRTQTIFELRIAIVTNDIIGGLGQALIDNATVREDRHLQERRDDMKAIFNKLKQLNKSGNSMFHKRLDLEHVGLTGGSHGGRTTLSVGENLSFIDAKAAFVIDIADYRGFVSPGIVGSDPDSIILDNDAKELTPVKPTLVQTALQDNIIYGFNLTDPNQAYPGNKQLLLDAQGPIMFSILDDANHSSAFLTLEEVDPGLIRNTICDIYDNTDWDPTSFDCVGLGTTYELKTPSEVNAIWNTKTVAFFDLYLKGKKKQCKLLISDEYEVDGLDTEYNNINCDSDSSS